MRIALITLALTALVFIGSIVYSLFGGTSSISLPARTSNKVETPIEIETLKYQIKNEEKINALMEKVDALSAGNQTQSTVTSSWSAPVPLSGKFLAQVMPAMEFTLIDNAGIYDLIVFDQKIEYSTYLDAKQWIKALPLTMKYDIFLKNMQAISADLYTTNETKSFPFRSFYVNPSKADTLVRLVIEVESQTIVLEIPKTKFATFKSLLLKK